MKKGFNQRTLKGAGSLLMWASLATTSVLTNRTSLAESSPSATAVRCKSVLDCPPPELRWRQDARCLESDCYRGQCGARIKTGYVLDGAVVLGGEFSCFSAPLVCDATGQPAAATESSRLIAIREGQHCIPPVASGNPCEKSVCRNKECVYEPHDEGSCSDSSIEVNACERRGCRNGSCQAVPDPRREGSWCGDSETVECRTTVHTCSAAGRCEASTRVAENAECADRPLVLGAPRRLPAAFKELVTTSATFPKYSCNVATCKLEFCGDGVINRDEECDGAATPPNAPTGRRCNASCKME
jgi:hypothetical protein